MRVTVLWLAGVREVIHEAMTGVLAKLPSTDNNLCLCFVDPGQHGTTRGGSSACVLTMRALPRRRPDVSDLSCRASKERRGDEDRHGGGGSHQEYAHVLARRMRTWRVVLSVRARVGGGVRSRARSDSIARTNRRRMRSSGVIATSITGTEVSE